MDPWIQIPMQVVMGLGLAASAGLRAFLPLLVVGVAGRAGVIPLAGPFEWMSSTGALIVFGVAVVAEVLADKIPLIDNALDAGAVFVKPVAGTMLAASMFTELGPLEGTVLGIATGGVTAGAVGLAKAKTRLLSTAASAGFANPWLSIGEDIGSLFGSLAVVFLAPLVAFVIVVLVGIALAVWMVNRSRRAPTGTAGA
jgi:hypothetical protein